MMLFEKACENFAKKMKASYNDDLQNDANGDFRRAMHEEVAEFVQKMERMTATGQCLVSCEDCPVTLAREMWQVEHCGRLTREEIRRIIAEKCE